MARLDQADAKAGRRAYKSLTWDRGKELADHKRFTMETDIDDFPKGLDLAQYSQAKLNKVTRQLNERRAGSPKTVIRSYAPERLGLTFTTGLDMP